MAVKNKHRGSTLDELLAREGVLDSMQSKVMREVEAARATRPSPRT